MSAESIAEGSDRLWGETTPAAESEPDSDSHQLIAEIGEWARSLAMEPSDLALESIVEEAVRIIPGTEYASLSIVSRDGLVHSRAPSHRIPRQLDAVQTELGEGPCFDSVRDHPIVRAPDLSAATPWPRFASIAVAEGVRSMLAFQLFVEVESLGALNLYSTTPRAFDEDAEDIGRGLAAHASLALAQSQKQGQLHEAVASRDLIGQAKGILMERHKLDEHHAFLLLAKVSSHTNRKLRDVAEEFVRTGALPGIVTD